MLTRTTAAIALLALISSCTRSPAQSEAVDRLFEPGAAAELTHPWIIRSAKVEVLLDAPAGDSHPSGSAPLAHLTLDPFSDLSLGATLTRIDPTESPAWVGTIDGDPLSEVVLVDHNGSVAGTIRTQDALYRIHSDEEGDQVVDQIAEADVPTCSEPLETPLDPQGEGSVNPDPPQVPDGGATVDLLVVYTAAAVSSVGGESAMQALIGTAVAETNQGYVNSGVDHRVALVHAEQVAYSEAGFNWSTTLTRLKEPSDSYLNVVHTMRETYGADQVALIVDNSAYCGLAYLMTTPAPSFDGYAFSVVHHGCATGYYSFGHELGHNMGSTHDHDNASNGAFSYSFGYQAPNAAFRTVMAYNCPGGCSRVNYWSNPAVNYGGQATGISGTGPTAASNTASLAQTSAMVAAFRAGAVPTPAVMSLPATGATLSDTSVTFTWSAVGATNMALSVGQSPGGRELAHLTNLGPVTQATVSGLPNDGSAVHTRLWTELDGEWQYTDAAYTSTSPAIFNPSTFTAPAPGATLSGASPTFTWADSGATQYRLFLGRYEGDRSIADETTTLTSLQLNGVPEDGGVLHARLWSLSTSGVWASSDRSFTAAAQAATVPSDVTTPSNGSTLPGEDVTFVWDDVGADEYTVFFGYAPGHKEIFSGSNGTQTSIDMTGLPRDGRNIYVTLWTRNGLEWMSSDAGYFTTTAASMSTSGVTSPPDGSTLSGTSATFSWTDVGADEYHIAVGLAQGHSEVFSGSYGTLTSANIGGLPTNGRDVWVRLWSRSGTEWGHTDTQYISAP